MASFYAYIDGTHTFRVISATPVAWSSSTTYGVGSVIVYNSINYVALVSNTDVLPTSGYPNPWTIAALYNQGPNPPSIPLGDLITTGDANDTTFLRGDGEWATIDTGLPVPNSQSNNVVFEDGNHNVKLQGLSAGSPTGAIGFDSGGLPYITGAATFSSSINATALKTSGEVRVDSTGQFFYPNGEAVVDSSNHLNFSNGDALADSAGNIYYGSGHLLADNASNIYYQSGHKVIDTYGNLYYGNGDILADESGDLYAPNYFEISGPSPAVTMFNTGGATLLFRMNQKNNNEGTLSWNVDGDNGDALDDVAKSAYKLSMDNNRFEVQTMVAGLGSWGGEIAGFGYNLAEDTFYTHGKLIAGSYQLTEGTGLYYPSGNILADSNGKLYFDNGTAFSSDGSLYYTNGAQMSDDEGELYVNGIPLVDNEGQIYYGALEMRMVDTEGRLYYADNSVMTDVTVSPKALYFPGSGNILGDSNNCLRYGYGAILSDYGGNLYYSGGDAGGNTYLADSYDSLYGGDGNVLFDNTTGPVQFNYPGLGSAHPLANAYGALFRGGNGGGQYLIDDYDCLYLSVSGGGIYDGNSSLGTYGQALSPGGDSGVYWTNALILSSINSDGGSINSDGNGGLSVANGNYVVDDSGNLMTTGSVSFTRGEYTFSDDGSTVSFGDAELTVDSLLVNGDIRLNNDGSAFFSSNQLQIGSYGDLTTSGYILIEGYNGNGFGLQVLGGIQAGIASSGLASTFDNGQIQTNGYGKMSVDGGAIYLGDGSNGGSASFANGALTIDDSGNLNPVQLYGAYGSKLILDSSAQLYHPNGNQLTDTYGDLCYSTGNPLADAYGNLKYNTGAVFADHTGKLYLPNATPASSTATGVQGQVEYDSSYVYVCVSTNSWKRTALSTW